MKNSFNAKNLSPFYPLTRRRNAFSLLAILLTTMIAYSFSTPQISAASTGSTLDYYLTIKPDFAGQGFDALSPQWIVAQQGDQIKLTIRNLGSELLHMQIEDQPEITVMPGTQNGNEIIPFESNVPIFSASTPGIFNLGTTEHPEIKGQIVVIPTDWVSYTPQTKTRSLTQIILPDFAGVGYDKYFPGVMVVNQGDLVNVTMRNTDDMAHGFALAAYGLDVTINAGSVQTNGTILPEDTVVQAFKASIPGTFEFFCTVPCGTGHSEMVGTFVVLPTGSNGYNPQPASQYEYLTIKPDFAGVGYDKYIPGSIFVNQNDIVNIKLRNTDEINHGFAMPSCGVNDQIIPSANMSSNGTLLPTDTFITEFFATKPGIHEFFCTNNCGAGHDQMIGYLVVLPTLSATPTAGQQTQTFSATSIFIFAALSIALLIAGILIGIIIIKKPEK